LFPASLSPDFFRRVKRHRFLKMMVADSWRAVLPAPHHPHPRDWPDDRLTASWLGHSTVLINYFGLNILTDPVFFDRCGIRLPLLTIGPKRYIACALRPAELPHIDLVLLSHAHFDHLDRHSLRAIAKDAVAVTARHTADILRGLHFRHVTEIGWDESREIETARGAVTISAFRLRHWGARVQHDDHREYNAYVLERKGKRLAYFGDTAHTPAHHLGSRGPIDLAIVPIGAYQPWIHAHCNPEEAVAMADEADARYVMPVHHQTFKLSWEPMDEPIQRFTQALHNAPDRVALTDVGQTFVLP
jgi:L-ascorbate metabolism protein UlaG (beta-lactamase superfamily)